MPRFELHIENDLGRGLQPVPNLGQSVNCSLGKSGTSSQPVDHFVAVNLANDVTEVRGFGQPITAELTKDIAVQYFIRNQRALSVLDKIEDGSINSINALKALPEYQELKSILAPQYQIVSGVFGKEAILQILAQKGCEGIRYIIGELTNENGQPQMTIVLVGVKEVTVPGNPAQSEPLAGWEYYQEANTSVLCPPDIEVHKSSLTMEELIRIVDQRNHGATAEDKIANAYLSVY